MNPPSATIFLPSAELVICLTPLLPQTFTAQTPLPIPSPAPLPTDAPFVNSVLSRKLCHVVFSSALVVIRALRKRRANVNFSSTCQNQCFNTQRALQLFPLKAERQHTDDCIINLPARAIPTPAASFGFAVTLEQVP